MDSIMIPVYQEVQSVPRLHEGLARMADAAPGAWEFLFVDDGSRDGTWEALRALERVQTKLSDGAEVLEVARDQRGVGHRSRCSD